jgi:tRNA pseudouridine38-40 synthase
MVVAETKNIRLIIEYDGGAFAGWQYQPNQRTIQGELEKALKKLTTRKVTLYGAGRTDAGVHARGQVANFRISHNLPLRKYRDGLNFYLPDTIRILEAESVPDDFHARFDAIYRRYRYLVGLGRTALESGRRWEIDFQPDIQLLIETADYILGEHDFAACCVVASQKENNRCLVYSSRWRRHGDVLIYDIMADRFLHSMIRSLVGLMMETAQGKVTLKRFKEILRNGDHTVIRKTAPAHGLYLMQVGY